MKIIIKFLSLIVLLPFIIVGIILLGPPAGLAFLIIWAWDIEDDFMPFFCLTIIFMIPWMIVIISLFS